MESQEGEMEISGFETERLIVRPWRAVLVDPASVATFELALLANLKPQTVRHLPPEMQPGLGRIGSVRDAIADWFAERIEEGEVMLVKSKASGTQIGLLMLTTPGATDDSTVLNIHYVLSERHWGEGIATELVMGLIAAVGDQGPLRLSSDVGHEHAASVRVLSNAGFHRDDRHSSGGTGHFIRDLPSRRSFLH